ncbi:unnamed protein product [Paramecium pentaurelia]|uniref:Uncharacterized protein n=1 Tax=Paramecium pentaurelia TaxID=43138 RepID=A0A8S1TQQ4_9CILI|nr:unnamed protein product [Paramecium pentaurelia]
MIQEDLEHKEMLKLVQIKVKSSAQAQWIQRILPLKQKLAFIYYDNGFYELYNIKQQVITQKGQISQNIRFFLEICTNVLIFHDPTDFQMKLLDLNMNQINHKFVFKSRDQIDIMDKIQFQVFFLDCDKNQIKYLISQDLEKHYSKNNVCHFTIRVLPLKYDSQTNFELKPVVKFDYDNIFSQEQLYNCRFGQDNDQCKSEIFLIKPHLMEQAFYIIHTQFQCSYTTINVTNWINPNQVAIWVNCNDSSTRPSIFCFDLRKYYNGQNWLPEPQFIATLVRDQYIANQPSVFMDIYQFHSGSTQVIQMRQVEYQSKISVINYNNIQEPQIIQQFNSDQFWITTDVNHSYILLRNGQLNIEDQTLTFQIINPFDEGLLLLKIIEKAKIIEKYDIHIVEELFEFYY